MHLSVLLQSGDDSCFYAMPSGSTAKEAVHAMAQERKTAVLVMDGGRMKGIVTRTDILKTLASEARTGPDTLPLTRIMTSELVVAGPEKSFQQALERMARSGIEHLPVVQDGRLLTVVHQKDLLRRRIEQLKDNINHLQEYIEGLHNAEKD